MGHGALTTAQVVAKIQDLLPTPPAAADHPPIARKPRSVESGKDDVRIRRVGRLLTQMAQCCQPAPFEPIAGYITQRARRNHPPPGLRQLAKPGQSAPRTRHRGRLGRNAGHLSSGRHGGCHDRSGLLRDITSILANEQVNVLGANTLTDRETSIARMGLTLEITDVVQLSRVLDQIGQLHNVVEAYRRVEVDGLGQAGQQPSGFPQQGIAPQQQRQSAAAALPPQGRRADAGQQQRPNPIAVLRVVQVNRCAADHDSRRQRAQTVQIDLGETSDGVAVFDRKVRQIRDDVLDTGTDGPQQIGRWESLRSRLSSVTTQWVSSMSRGLPSCCSVIAVRCAAGERRRTRRRCWRRRS